MRRENTNIERRESQMKERKGVGAGLGKTTIEDRYDAVNTTGT